MAKKDETTETKSKSVIKGKDVLYTFHLEETGMLTVTFTKKGEKIRSFRKPDIKRTAMWFSGLMEYTLERMRDEGRPTLHITCSVP